MASKPKKGGFDLDDLDDMLEDMEGGSLDDLDDLFDEFDIGKSSNTKKVDTNTQAKHRNTHLNNSSIHV